MRFMVMVKADENSEAGEMPSEELLAEMGAVQRGAGQGRRDAGRRGAAPELEGRPREVLRHGPQRRSTGPFAETKELIAGYWLCRSKSMDEAIEWVKRCPNPMEGESEIEIRQVFEAEDFGDELTPELREQEERIARAGGSRTSSSRML